MKRTAAPAKKPIPKIQINPDVLIVKGGKPLEGEVTVRGAKNAIPKNFVAALLTPEPCRIANVANIEDVDIVRRMIKAMGGDVKATGDGMVEVRSKNVAPVGLEVLKPLAGKSRMPILFTGPLLARFGRASIPQLGGCGIGPRPVNFHLDALTRLGATIRELPEGFEATARRLKGAKIRLEYPSVGATEQVLLAAVLADGVTELANAAVEPEIIDLIALLQKMGAVIEVHTDRVIRIVGVPKLHGFDHAAMTDRIEVASWASLAAATGGSIFVRNARQLDMVTFLNKFRQIGGTFAVSADGILFSRNGRLKSIAIETDVHPGFMTDWQQPFTVVLTQAEGASIVHETVYEDRFGYVPALQAMGASIQLYRECLGSVRCRFGQRNHYHSVVVTGPAELHGADIEVPDLRAGFSYIVAALAADGISRIGNMQTIRRGYEHIVEKLRGLNADIRFR